jgi:undecaprenyl-diphosphatase
LGNGKGGALMSFELMSYELIEQAAKPHGPHITYLQAVVTGLIQGVTELFPVSSLGHNVLLPGLIGGSWAAALNVSAKNSPYLAFIVGLHVATAIAMIAFFWRDWLRIVRGFVSSVAQRRIATPDQRLAWMIILATIPVGIVGAVAQKEFTKVFAKPELAAAFLAVNGVILLVSERMRRNKTAASGGSPAVAAAVGPAGGPGLAAGPPQGYQQQPWQQQWQGPDPRYGRSEWDRLRRSSERGEDQGPYGQGQYGQGQYGQDPWGGRPGQDPREQSYDPWGAQNQQAAGSPGQAGHHAGGTPAGGTPAGGTPAGAEADPAVAADLRLSTMSYPKAVFVGASQILALFPGISRDGIVTVAGMGRGLNRQDAVRFSFLLSAPVILAAGALKAHDLTGPLSTGIHGPIVVGSLLSGIGAYLSIRFLTKYFSDEKSLNPFGYYCLIAGIGSLAYLLLK